jgi:broad specificity phosphatase PhoE
MDLRSYPEWEPTIAQLALGSRSVMLIGATDTGKTTFCRLLVNAATAAGRRVAIVDADIGQSEIGPPACVGLGEALSPVEALGDLTPSALAFVGSTSPRGVILEHAVAVRAMADAAMRRDPDLVVVDTTGFIRGTSAQRLKLAKAGLLGPADIVAIERRGECALLLAPFRSAQRARVHRLPVPALIGTKSPALRAQRRAERLLLHLVRHGTTVWNAEGRLQGQSDVPLSAEGRVQAERVARRLAAVPLSAVWCSDLARARETAEIVAASHDLPVTATPLLREVMFGSWEGLTRDDIVRQGDGAAFEAYLCDALAHPAPDSEPLPAMWERLLGALRAIRCAHEEGSVAVIGHGSSLRVLLCEALGAPMACLRRTTLYNASLSIVEYLDDRPRVCLLNDTCHLRAD